MSENTDDTDDLTEQFRDDLTDLVVEYQERGLSLDQMSTNLHHRADSLSTLVEISNILSEPEVESALTSGDEEQALRLAIEEGISRGMLDREMFEQEETDE